VKTIAASSMGFGPRVERRVMNPSRSEPGRSLSVATYSSVAPASTRGRVHAAPDRLTRRSGRKAAEPRTAAHQPRYASAPDPSLFLAALRICFSWPPSWANTSPKLVFARMNCVLLRLDYADCNTQPVEAAILKKRKFAASRRP